MSARVTWAKGGSAEITAIEGDAVTILSTTPAPPGARIEGRAALEGDVAIKVKVHGSKRMPDGAFVITGRMLDATRAVLDAVAALCVAPRA
jgi:hypothetical protein